MLSKAGIILLSVCLSVCLCLHLSMQQKKQKNYWSEIDVSWTLVIRFFIDIWPWPLTLKIDGSMQVYALLQHSLIYYLLF